MQDADLDSVNDGLSEALASIPDPTPAVSDTVTEPTSDDGPPRDERGRFAGKEPEATTEPKAGDGEDREGGQIPSWRLREIREERDRIAAERDQDRQRLQALERERAQWQASQRQQREAQEAPQRPDPINDPEGFAEYIQSLVERGVQSERESRRNDWVNLTFHQVQKANPEAFEKAMQALEQAGDRQAVVNIRENVNPGEALMRWHRQETARREVGDDIEGYNKRLRDKLKADPEFRKEFMAELETEARGNSGRSSDNNVTGFPSLNRAPGGGARQTPGHLGDSDAEIYENLTRKRG